jgi:hypothetical protein
MVDRRTEPKFLNSDPQQALNERNVYDQVKIPPTDCLSLFGTDLHYILDFIL